ncbi:MAG: Mov34/MPN/PAD-1 family protein [Methanobacteriaceae archaeon]|nr:Mov34/MPN/PAD-1 family protein [Methanobacteriaceae archaeon]
MKILISKTNVQLLNKLYDDYYNYEIGGVLLGKIFGKDISITDIVYNINRDKLNQNKYVRKVSDIKNIMMDTIVKSNHEIDYIGEWHTHIGLNSMYSSVDKKAMNELNEDFPELILLIKSKVKISTFLFTRDNIKKIKIKVLEDI